MKRTTLYVGLVSADGRTKYGSDTVRHYCAVAGVDCTVTEAIGLWRGKAEHSAVVTVLQEASADGTKLRGLANMLKHELRQEAILVTEDMTVGVLV